MLNGVNEKTRTKGDLIAGLIQDELLSGKFAPGMRLQQVDLAQRYGTSTTPVREALRKLEAIGLLVQVPHRGHVIAVRSAAELADIYGVRILVEGWQAELAGSNIRSDDLDALRDLGQQMRRVEGDLVAYRPLSVSFHHRIYQAADRPTLFAISENIRRPLVAELRQYVEAGGRIETLDEQHERMLEACAARDGAALKHLTTLHIETFRNKVVPFLERLERVPTATHETATR
jgi:DNA-binding GntR family transcriptional regulator